MQLSLSDKYWRFLPLFFHSLISVRGEGIWQLLPVQKQSQEKLQRSSVALCLSLQVDTQCSPCQCAPSPGFLRSALAGGVPAASLWLSSVELEVALTD